jgi:truncated hemoglobin YjbI
MATLFEHAGGEAALHRLEDVFYSSVLADPLLQPVMKKRPGPDLPTKHRPALSLSLPLPPRSRSSRSARRHEQGPTRTQTTGSDVHQGRPDGSAASWIAANSLRSPTSRFAR